MKFDSVLWVLPMAVCFVLGLSFPALGQEPVPAAKDSVAKQNDAGLEIMKDNTKIFLDKIEILGRIEKPQTVFIITGKDATVNDIEIDRSFFKEIFRPVERDVLRRRREISKEQANPKTN